MPAAGALEALVGPRLCEVRGRDAKQGVEAALGTPVDDAAPLARAEALKQLGNGEYKAQRFAEAVAVYNAALTALGEVDLDKAAPDALALHSSVRSNASICLLELGLYESAQAAWRLLTRRSSLGARTRLAAAALSGGMSAVLVWRVTVPRVTTN